MYLMKRLLVFLYNLSIKKLLFTGVFLSLLLTVPLIALLLKNETTIFSDASIEGDNLVSQVDESQIPYPSEPPSIELVTKYYGRGGDSVLILGDNFGEAQKESKVILGINSLSKENIAYWSNEEIEISLPQQPGVYPVTVNINGNTASWWGKVVVYNELTPNAIFVDERVSLIRVTDPSVNLKIHSVTGDIKVLGSPNFVNNTNTVPLNLTDSNILYVEMTKAGAVIPFRVEPN